MFETKVWSDRISQYPNRRKIKDLSNNSETIVDITREEGNISNVGTSFSANNMNNLEQRISSMFPVSISNGGTGGTNATTSRQNLELLKAFVLYNNDAGNEGTVTLSDDADNYEILDIIIWDFYVTRIYDRNDRPVGLMKIGGYGENFFEWYSESISIYGNTIIRNSVTHGVMSGDGTIDMDFTSHIPIRTVIGYKY